VTETIIAGVIVAGLAVTMACVSFGMFIMMWTEFQEWRDKRKDKK